MWLSKYGKCILMRLSKPNQNGSADIWRISNRNLSHIRNFLLMVSWYLKDQVEYPVSTHSGHRTQISGWLVPHVKLPVNFSNSTGNSFFFYSKLKQIKLHFIVYFHSVRLWLILLKLQPSIGMKEMRVSTTNMMFKCLKQSRSYLMNHFL